MAFKRREVWFFLQIFKISAHFLSIVSTRRKAKQEGGRVTGVFKLGICESVLLTDTQSKFASVVLDDVLGSPRQAQHTR